MVFNESNPRLTYIYPGTLFALILYVGPKNHDTD